MLYLHYGLPGTKKTEHVKKSIVQKISKVQTGTAAYMQNIYVISYNDQWVNLASTVVNYTEFLVNSCNVRNAQKCIFVFDNFEVARNYNLETQALLKALIAMLSINNTVYVISSDLSSLLSCTPVDIADKYCCHYISLKNNKACSKMFNDTQFLEFTSYCQGAKI